MTMTRKLISENWSENYTKQWKQMLVTGEKMTPNSGLSIRKWAVMMNLGKIYQLMTVIHINLIIIFLFIKWIIPYILLQ